MTITMPHPDEFARLNWRQRDRAIRAARALLRAYGATVGEDMTGDNFRPAAESARRADKAWGERVRAEARAMQARLMAGEGSAC